MTAALILFVIAGGFFFLASREKLPPPAPPPPERRQYAVSIVIGSITIDNLIIAEVPRPFVEALIELEVKALTESYTRRWYAAYSMPADDAAYRSLESALMAIASPDFIVRRAVVRNLSFERTSEPSPAEILVADIDDRVEHLVVGREKLDALPDDPDFGAILKESVATVIKNGIQRESFLARRRRDSRRIKSYRFATAVPPK